MTVDTQPQSGDVKLGVQEEPQKSKRFQKTPCAIGCSAWCKKFFWEGQLLKDQDEIKKEEVDVSGLPWHQRVLIKHRRLVAVGIPITFCHFIWWGIAINYNLFYLFKTKYYLSLVMIIGSIIAGMTSEGGGAVAFPVLTLAFKVSPSVARDVSMMIQSCGMSAATFAIFFMKVKLEYRSLIFCSIGGVIGQIFGQHIVDPNLTAAEKKICFVSIWFSFAFALFLLNLHHKRKTFTSIQDFGVGKAILLVVTGFVGGMFTSFAGSGLDICVFSILTLLFRVTEKVATPTSVVLMATNSLFGIYWQGVIIRKVTQEAWDYITVTAPVVVIGAPIGSLIGTHFHRHILASAVYIIDTIALIGAYILVPMTPVLIGLSVGIIMGGFVFFFVLTKLGEWLMKRTEKWAQEAKQELEYCENPDEQPVPNAKEMGRENPSFTIDNDTGDKTRSSQL